MWNEDIVLENSVARVRSITAADQEKLALVTPFEEVWRYMVVCAYTPEELRAYMADALTQRENRARYTFVVEDVKTGKVVGATAFGNYSAGDKRIEIGWTWLTTGLQGSGINSNVKALLMAYAFDTMGLERVEFKTDVLNLRARAALRKVGAVEEGVMRSHTLMPTGRRRDTIYYSVLKNEWPAVRAMHAEKLGVSF